MSGRRGQRGRSRRTRPAGVSDDVWRWVERARVAAGGRPVVGVMGGGRDVAGHDAALAGEFARLVSDAGAAILTGGGPGIMEAASASARIAIGVVPGLLPSDGYPNRFVTEVLFTGLGALDVRTGNPGRNQVNVLASDVIVACRGRVGTESEIRLALENDTPVAMLGWEVADLGAATLRVPRGLNVDIPEFQSAEHAATWALQVAAD